MSEFSGVLDHNEVCHVIESSFSTKEYVLRDWEIKPMGDDGVGFLGEHLRLYVTVEVGGKVVERSFFVKAVPKDKDTVQYELAVTSGAFMKEIDIYKFIVRFLDEEYGVGWCPKFHYSRKHEVLVLEDISSRGFRLSAERQYLDKAHMLQALTTLADMHASSILFEHNVGRLICDMYPYIVRETIWSMDEPLSPFAEWCRKVLPPFSVLADLLDGYTEQQREVIRRKLVPTLSEVFTFVKKSNRYQNVLSHGDMWSNNILYRYDKHQLVDCQLVDFQMSRYLPPAADVMSIMYLNLHIDLLTANELSFKRHYYDQFVVALKRHGLLADQYMTWAAFDESCRVYRQLGNSVALLT